MVKIGAIELSGFPLILSPMEEVTDKPFRLICKEHGADMLISEFIASDALIRDVEKSQKKMIFENRERPFGIQIFGNEVEPMVRAAQIAENAKPDFVDINWGCPVKKIAGKGCGSGMLKDIPRLLEITHAVVKAVKLPVTVKTRLGYDDQSLVIVELAERLQDIGVQAISIHARTKKQMYQGQADWTLIGKTKENPRLKIPVFGNGDITSPEKALGAKNRFGVDGILIGRGAIGNPWIFAQTKDYFETKSYKTPSVKERVAVCRQHLHAAIQWKEEKVAILEMRKHYGNYFKALPDFKPFRIKLVSQTELQDLEETFGQILKFYSE